MSVFSCSTYMSLALPKSHQNVRIIHRDSWKPEIKLLSAKIPSHSYNFKWKPRHLPSIFLFSSEKPFENMGKNLIKLKLLPDIRKRRDFQFPFSNRAFFRAMGLNSKLQSTAY